jgi:hypothetical protein
MPGEPEGEGVVNTVTFSETAGRTTLAILTETGSKELRDTIVKSGMEGGVQEQMEIIEEIARTLR